MERLAFIRIMHQEAIGQSQRPAPLNRISVLTFHDAVEHFLVLAAEHLQARLPNHTQFMKYWTELDPNKLPSKVALSGKVGMDRLNRRRNDFKHLGHPPGDETIEFARNDVKGFFEDNCPRVFGLDYADIDMADLIPQDATRSLVKRAAKLNAAGSRTEAMARLHQAFQELFHQRVGHPYWGNAFTFGGEIKNLLGAGPITTILSGGQHGNPRRTAERLAMQLETVTQATMHIQAGLRVIAMGIDYLEYHRFLSLVPGYIYAQDQGEETKVTIRVSPHTLYAASDDEYEYCLRFVISAALRFAEVESLRADPSWMPSPP